MIVCLCLASMMYSAVALAQETIDLHFDRPFYLNGQRIWFSALLTNRDSTDIRSGILQIELISPDNKEVYKSKIKIQGRLAHGHLEIPSDALRGYYQLRAYTLFNLSKFGAYAFADIPIYSDFEDPVLIDGDDVFREGNNASSLEGQMDNGVPMVSPGDSVKMTLELNSHRDTRWSYSVAVTRSDLYDLVAIETQEAVSKEGKLADSVIVEDELYLAGKLTDPETGKAVDSRLISVYSAGERRFFRATAGGGVLSTKVADFYGSTTLQIFNLNPYQTTVNTFDHEPLAIPNTYINPQRPPLTATVAREIIASRKRRVIEEIFALSSSPDTWDTTKAFPRADAVYVMDEYQYLVNLEEFIREAVPNARVRKDKNSGMESDSRTVRLYNPQVGRLFPDRPWYIVDGYLTSRENEVLNIPFKDIREIRLYFNTSTIREYFEFFLWRNGIMEVITRDIKYLRSFKKEPNFVDFLGIQPNLDFSEALPVGALDTPDLRTTIHFAAGWCKNAVDIGYQQSDDVGDFVLDLIAISDEGEIIRKRKIIKVR